MAVAFDAATPADPSEAKSHSFNHTTAGSDRALVVVVTIESDTVEATGVTYNGASLTRQGRQVNANGTLAVEVWGLAGPATGTNAVEVTFGSSIDSGITAISFTGVDQTTSFGTTATASGVGTDVSVDVTSETDGMVVDGVVAIAQGGGGTPGSGQTERSDFEFASGGDRHYSSTEPGAASVTMSWTLATSRAWAQVGTPLAPAAATGGTTGGTRSLLTLGVGA